MKLSGKVRIAYKLIEFFIAIRFVAVILHELAHYYSFKLLGEGSASISYRVMIFTDLLREPSLLGLFFVGPWLEGLVTIDTPIEPAAWDWQFTIYILSGLFVHILFSIYYSAKRFRSTRYRVASMSFMIFTAIVGGTADLDTAYYYMGIFWIPIFFKYFFVISWGLFYLGLTALVWPYATELYLNFRGLIKNVQTPTSN